MTVAVRIAPADAIGQASPDAQPNAIAGSTAELSHERRILIVSNRLPFALAEQNGEPWLFPTSGGLASALRAIHAKSNSVWMGSAEFERAPAANAHLIHRRLTDARLLPIELSEMETRGYYRNYANGVLWPVLHGLSPAVPWAERGWAWYQSVNERFADAVAAEWRAEDTIWVHDYHMMLLPQMLRRRLPHARIGFFLHTPFPASGGAALPEWDELAHGLLGADVVGLQTRRDLRGFARAVGWTHDHGASTAAATHGGRLVRAMACPIAIDHSAFVHRSRHPAVLTQAAGMQAATAGPLFVGVDRLDYTKGIPERLLAFERLLHFEPGLRGQARFIQIAVPTRHGVAGYDEIRASVAALVARINAVHGTASWTPVEYVCGSVDRTSLVALYRAATVMVVSPKADGMNLVAKEFVASRTDGRGVLVLSRTAGAAEELRAAVLVDPHDVSSIMEGYRRAIRMSAVERRSRMRKLREVVLSRDVFVWAHQLLTAVAEREPFEQHAGPATIGSHGGESTLAFGFL